MVLEVEGPHKWAFVCISLGDCKAYHWSVATKTITEVTAGNRMNISDPKGIKKLSMSRAKKQFRTWG